MILDPTLLSVYIVVAGALAVAPGPDVLFVLANGMQHRAKGAAASALGIGAGSLVHAIAAAIGISALIATTPWAFDLLRYAGALYLAWLGVQALWAFYKGTGGITLGAEGMALSPWRVFQRGLTTNILNPKVIAFYLALLPQFVNPELGHIGLQLFALGCIHNALGLTYLLAIGCAAGKAAAWLKRASFARWMDGVAGVCFIGLAIRMALSEEAAG